MDSIGKGKGGAQFFCQCVMPDGTIRWEEMIYNLRPTEALNDILEVWLKSGTQNNWYVGLIDNANFTNIQSTDTAAKLTTSANPPTTNAWQETVAYDELNRIDLILGTVSNGTVNNSANVASFSINATVTINGVFIVTDNAKAGNTGVLGGASSFTVARPAVDNDTLNVTVVLTETSA